MNKPKSEPVVVSRAIAASSMQVWSMVADVTRMGEWSPENESCVWAKGSSGPTVGARFIGSNRNGKKSWKTSCVITQCEPGRVFRFDVQVGPLNLAQWTYEFLATDQGCVVTESTVNYENKLVAKLGDLLSGVTDRAEHNRAGMEQTLARLGKKAEGSSPAAINSPMRT
jgi:uncharacterized protein YndB with AHSA1/START domain